MSFKNAKVQVGLNVEERNALTNKYYHAIVSKPKFKVGQKVVASPLGIEVKFLDADQVGIVTRVDDKLAEETGNPSATHEVQLFNKEGHLLRLAVDPRFIKSEKGESVNE